MLWLIALLFLGLIAWGVLTWGPTDGSGDGQGFAVFVGGIGLAVTVSILSSTTFSNGEQLAYLQAFYESNNQNYATTDEVNSYNRSIARLKYYDSNIWTAVLVPDEVQNMRFLKIGE